MMNPMVPNGNMKTKRMLMMHRVCRQELEVDNSLCVDSNRLQIT